MIIKKHQIITKMLKIRIILQQKKSSIKSLVLRMFYLIPKHQPRLTVRYV